MVFFQLAGLGPGCEPTGFAVVPVVCKPEFWADEEDFAVEEEDATVVFDAFVGYWPGTNEVSCRSVPEREFELKTHIPTSMRISRVSGDSMILARTSQECRNVSPSKGVEETRQQVQRIFLETKCGLTFQEVIGAAISARIAKTYTELTSEMSLLVPQTSRKHLISSSGPARSLAPFAFATRMDSRIRSRFPPKSSAH